MTDLRHREFNTLKILHHVDRLRGLARGDDIAPVTLEIDPVAYCNHRCGWCVDPVHEPVRMADALFDSLIEELSGFEVNGFRVEGIVFKGGGEPTLHPGFGRMLATARSAGFAVGVVTNGSRLDRWAEVLASRAAYVRVSIDGPTPDSHARVHATRDFERVVRGAAALVAARGESRHPVLGASFAMDASTASLAAEAIALGERLGLDYVVIRPPFFEEVGAKPTMSMEQARATRAALRRAAAEYDGPLDVQVGDWVGDAEQDGDGASEFCAGGRRHSQRRDLPIEHRTGRCWASPLLLVITADGHVYGCCNLRGLGDWRMGRLDYESGSTLRVVWESAFRRRQLGRMHATECIRHCTHPLSRYNELIEVLRDDERPHSEFV